MDARRQHEPFAFHPNQPPGETKDMNNYMKMLENVEKSSLAALKHKEVHRLISKIVPNVKDLEYPPIYTVDEQNASAMKLSLGAKVQGRKKCI